MLSEQQKRSLRAYHNRALVAKSQLLVYLLRFGVGGPVKVGIAKNPALRAAELQCGAPEKLRVIVTVRGSIAMEKTIHRMLREIRMSGEWFQPGPETDDLIETFFAMTTARVWVPEETLLQIRYSTARAFFRVMG